MNDFIESTILNATGASGLHELNKIQELWSGYGFITRYGLEGSNHHSVVVKHVNLPTSKNHPRGWNSDLSHKRKLRSYRVESTWYRNWSSLCDENCYVPNCLALEAKGDEILIVLEDLDASGFGLRRNSASIAEIKTCLNWLANFHATFMGKKPQDLWKTGTYWHLATRPDELKALKDQELKNAASEIDKKLRFCEFQTFVHGDAKLANFCFSRGGQNVAAVDFQYVGGGCGMKDVAYFIGSCLNETECQSREHELLALYFGALKKALKKKSVEVDEDALVAEWRELYAFAWTDFHRFIKGWSPGHWKINSYSERVAREVIKRL